MTGWRSWTTSYPDGTPNSSGVQLDQTAVPIVLAWQLKAVDRYQSLVKPAADFIAGIGPATPQDRWEEQGGYSPATLAAEIAALVCAADLAQQAGDSAMCWEPRRRRVPTEVIKDQVTTCCES